MASVFVLGAGFSRAVSDHMPMMKNLSTLVAERLQDRDIPGADKAVASDFEQWLSFLLDRPPWLSTAEQERNRAGFFAVAEAVHQILVECQAEAVESQGEQCPEWLQRLVAHWQDTDATVITFNYDNLVELAWRIHGVPSAPQWRIVYPLPIPLAASRFRVTPGALLAPQLQGLKLLKLHGSLSWRYTGPDGTPGDLIYETAGWFENPEWNAAGISSPDERDALSEDLYPMIVPPTAVKSPYYSNRTLQANWKRAARELGAAEEIVLMGFSLPPTDLTVSSLLATTRQDDVQLTPVNTRDDIVIRLPEALGIQASQVRTEFIDEDDPIAKWVNATV
jgi:hypothetical protein